VLLLLIILIINDLCIYFWNYVENTEHFSLFSRHNSSVILCCTYQWFMLFLLRGFSVQSTNMDRTIESLRCVIAGMFGVYTFSQSGTIYVTHFNIIYNIISHAPLGGCLCFTHSPSIVPMCRLTGGLPLQWLAHSSGLAVLACVRCQGGPLSSVPLIRTTHSL